MFLSLQQKYGMRTINKGVRCCARNLTVLPAEMSAEFFILFCDFILMEKGAILSDNLNRISPNKKSRTTLVDAIRIHGVQPNTRLFWFTNMYESCEVQCKPNKIIIRRHSWNNLSPSWVFNVSNMMHSAIRFILESKLCAQKTIICNIIFMLKILLWADKNVQHH